MQEFTYRSARSGSLVLGLGFAIAIETGVLQLWLAPHHPVLAWIFTLSSSWMLGWLAMDYHALGHGTLGVDVDAIDLRVGRGQQRRTCS